MGLHSRKLLSGLVALLAVLALWLFLRWFIPLDLYNLEWLGCENYFGVTRPPVPSFAEHIQIDGCGPFGSFRIIRFETDKSVNEIQQFYRTELTKRGWSVSCDLAQGEQTGCPLGDYAPIADLRDGYEHDHKPLNVWSIDLVIFKPGDQVFHLANQNNRLVELVEYRYSLINNAQTVPDNFEEREIPLTPGVYPWPGASYPTPMPTYSAYPNP